MIEGIIALILVLGFTAYLFRQLLSHGVKECENTILVRKPIEKEEPPEITKSKKKKKKKRSKIGSSKGEEKEATKEKQEGNTEAASQREEKIAALKSAIKEIIEKGSTNGMEDGPESLLAREGVLGSDPSCSFIARCYHCLGPRTKVRPLQRCSACQLVSYCSKNCQKDNFYMHKYFCKEFKVVDGKNCLYTKGSWEDHLAQLKVRAERVQLREDFLRKSIFATPRVCHTCHESTPEFLTECKCAAVCYCSKRCAKADKEHILSCSRIGRKEQEFSLHYMLMSYSQSIRYAVAFFKTFVNVTSINLHIVSSCPMLDLEQWEQIVIHSSPNLLHLNIVFVVQNRKYKPSKETIAKNNQPICRICKTMGRSITYSIHKMPYHMYYSSEEYVEPNYVAIFGNTREMAANPDELKENLNSEISYRNMLSNPKTYIILFDETKELLEQGLITVSALDIPFTTIIKPRLNEYRAFTSIRAELGLAEEGYNDRMYFTMFRKSNPMETLQHLLSSNGLAKEMTKPT